MVPGASALLGVAAVLVGALAAACSADGGEPVDPAPSIAAAPQDSGSEGVGVVAEEQQAPLGDRPADAARPIMAGDGRYPISQAPAELPELPAAVGIGGHRIWIPWPPYPAAERDRDGRRPATATGSHSELLEDAERGHGYVIAQRARWEAMPAYLPDAETAFAEGSRVARRRAGTETAWELAVDPAGHRYETSITADGTAAYDHVSLCPPHPTPDSLGADLGGTDAERDRAGAVIEAFVTGMRSPGGRPMHSWGATVNDVAKLLVYSPGEPMELALGGHSLADVGFFPGDWSEQAKAWLTRRAAQGAVTDSLIGHAAVSRGPDTLWEACSDLATITPGVYTASQRTRRLESLWARGLRLEFTTAPVERAWVADLSAAGHALAVVCHPPGQSFLVDASTGERLDAGADHPAQVEAMWLTWSRLSYRVLRNALFEGGCDSGAFADAVQWLAGEQDAHAETIDWSEPRAWASGVRNQWAEVRDWVEVPQAEAWQAHRGHRWHLAHWCETGIPVGVLIDGELLRPELQPHCTAEQWSTLREAAASAPEVTWELSATKWAPGASWHERMYLSPFKSLDDVLGCAPDPDVIAGPLSGPIEQRMKKPWPPGSLPRTPPDRAYPRPMPPCPRAVWPPQADRYWWPEAAPLAEASSAEVSS
ncbi:MAG: hypothetical protein F4Z53_15915 [Acidimicrobiales bacterium]|nr:hypothetical protein [Acidimicrobiales bacterium]MYI10254.1 hypothetical protein [Acidimicrobiales bacterium]MYI26599.1 hypothetical protein [Acidimicrobiales bacterium]